jgi:allantoinase
MDLVVRGGTVVTSSARVRADIGIERGTVVDIAPELPGARAEIDARGLFVIPGVIDVHVHFNEPGRTEWEGAATGSRAFAAGGGTVFFDMPLNSTPCTVNVQAFDRKRRALESSSITDFGLWGGLIPGSVPNMAELAERGVVGFKAFMCDAGLPEFPCADDRTLIDGMHEAARLGLPVAVHAESEEVTKACAAAARGRGARDFLASRPLTAELQAIRRALQIAREARVKLHIVHVSSGSGIAMAAEARAAGVDVSTETCPHYLFFTQEDLERLGTVAKCAPPLRSVEERDALWTELRRGRIDIVASDHSPTDPALKAGDFMSAWGGIAGVQSTLAVLLDRSHDQRGLAFQQIAALLAEAPARRFAIPRKGRIAAGYDADLAVIDPDEWYTLTADHLHQRHKTSPYIGSSFDGVVRYTIRRGETIFNSGRITAPTTGRLVRPAVATVTHT